MKLRDYQLKAVEAISEAWKTARSTLLVLPTGCGKTVVFGEPTLDVIKVGLKDSHLSVIKEKLNFSGSKFCAILDFFKERFDLCFQALREFRA